MAEEWGGLFGGKTGDIKPYAEAEEMLDPPEGEVKDFHIDALLAEDDGEVVEIDKDGRPSLAQLCKDCMDAHPGCDGCCGKCGDQCNMAQVCRWPNMEAVKTEPEVVEMSDEEKEKRLEEVRKLDPLTQEEQDRLYELEKIVIENMPAFFRLGAALKEIRERRLYRETHAQWEDYCQEKFDIGRRYANYKIAAADVVETLGTIVPKDKLPWNEAQVRPLTKLPEPDLQIAAWQGAIAESAGKRPTAKAVEKVVKEMTPGKNRPEPTRKDGKRPEEVYSKVFEEAITGALWKAIDEERARDWKRTTKEAAVQWLKRSIKYVENHG